jgi:SET domain-containing protein
MEQEKEKIRMIVKKVSNDYKGVFSTKPYEIGQLVYTFDPQYVEQPTRTSIQHEDKHFEDKIGMYLNHNCLPNTDIVSDGRGIHLLALEIIRKEDELTFDYNRTESKLTNPFYCRCHGLLIKGYDG